MHLFPRTGERRDKETGSIGAPTVHLDGVLIRLTIDGDDVGGQLTFSYLRIDRHADIERHTTSVREEKGLTASRYHRRPVINFSQNIITVIPSREFLRADSSLADVSNRYLSD